MLYVFREMLGFSGWEYVGAVVAFAFFAAAVGMFFRWYHGEER